MYKCIFVKRETASLIRIIRDGLLACSAVLLIFLWLCYWGRFDFCTAVTVYPPWCWAVGGLVITGIGFSRRLRAVSIALVAGWLLFVLSCSDSPASLLRAWMPRPQSPDSFRLITLNCAGIGEAAQEVVSLKPDIVLLQESPRPEELSALAEQLYGPGMHIHRGPDASIVALGEISIVNVTKEHRENFVHARVVLKGTSIDVISLRLLPSVFRMDLWSPRCWEAFRENRERRRQQLQKIAKYIETIPPDRPLIAGGDFNCPPGDAVLRLLRPRLSDSFTAAGRGWGGTIINDWPAIRIDAIWVSRQLRSVAVVARKTLFSDHRMVVGDFALADGE